MSDALNYLVQFRPEAMGAYFKFLKKAGDHLDTRTRDLISVISKVHVQTERGFRQYLSRALRNGAAPDEVIDALLMAFPILGLAKINWAVDILLEMDIPEFRPENLGSEARWHDVAPLSAVEDGETRLFDCDGRHLFVHRSADEYRIYDSRCPHQVTDIPNLALEGATLTCPKHNWQFDVTTGQCIAKGSHPLRQFDTKSENGTLYAWW
jgi:nitrite reductase/ring-hydroxylating ferredoxin subunit/alkylhydroperoxidase/carboxymuconolactone decarboxylase family protein YurZ